MTERRDTPTVRPGSGSMSAVSFADLAATAGIKLAGLERLRASGAEVDAVLIVYGEHLARVFGEWHQGRPPDRDTQAREIRRYLEWLPKVDALLKGP